MEAGGMILGHRAGIYYRRALIFREICHNMSSVTSFPSHGHVSLPTGSSCQTQRNTLCVILELHHLRLHNDLGWKSHSWTSCSFSYCNYLHGGSAECAQPEHTKQRVCLQIKPAGMRFNDKCSKVLSTELHSHWTLDKWRSIQVRNTTHFLATCSCRIMFAKLKISFDICKNDVPANSGGHK